MPENESENLSSEPEVEIAFNSALEELLTDERVPVHLLFHLSDMSTDERAEFDRRWPEADDERRREIARHLVDISEENFVVDFYPIYISCLGDPNPMVRIAGLDGLWDSTDLNLVRPILDLLENDPVAEVQASAAGALAHYLIMSDWGQLDGVPVDSIAEGLLKAYQDPGRSLAVRRTALEALGAVNLPEISSLIEAAYEGSNHDLQLSALFAMGNSADDRWLTTVLDEMESPYDDMRLEAARAAGNIGHEDAIPSLTELAYDENIDIARIAVAALGEIGGDRVEAILLEMSEDADMNELAEEVLEALEESSWYSLDLQFGMFEALDEEE